VPPVSSTRRRVGLRSRAGAGRYRIVQFARPRSRTGGPPDAPGAARIRRGVDAWEQAFPHSGIACALALALLLATTLAGAQPGRTSRGGLSRLPGLERVQFNEITWTAEEVFLSGHVELETGAARILADEVRYRLEEEVVEAIGNVVLSFPGAVLSGRRLVYHVKDETGEIEEAVGYLEEDDATLRAARIERIGPRRLRVEDAVFTTCTQPVPYWSFSIARGTFNLGDYAYLKGVRFKTGRVPVFYTPYLAWPIKTDRASGLLFPEFNSSDKLGQSISLPFYWPVSDNADITFLLDYHSKVGIGMGAILDWLPTWRGAARGDVYWINDQVRGENRYSVEWEQKQELGRDLRLTSNVEFISDFNYLTDYETDLRRAASPNTRSTIDVTRNWSWYSLSMRTIRDEQFFVGGLGLTRFLTGKVINIQLPEIELRGRSQRLGKTPFYFSFQSSAAGFRKRILEPPESEISVSDEDDLITRVSNDWYRADFAPSVQIPVLRLPWIDLQVNTGWRGTWYSARPDPLDTQRIEDESVSRNLWNSGVSLSGPRIQGVFDTPRWEFSPKLKHVIEPFLVYQWRPSANTGTDEIIVFDEIDSIPGELSDVTYGIRQRLFGLRAPSSGRQESLSAASEVSFDGLDRQIENNEQRDLAAGEEPAVEEQLDVDSRLNPTEFLSLEIFQRYSFVRPLSTVFAVLTDLEGNDLVDPVTGRPRTAAIETRNASPVTARLRFNPTVQNTVDLSYVYDTANKKVTETSISATLLYPRRAYFRGSWFRRQPADPAFSDETSFLRTSVGISRGPRFRFETSLDYDVADGQLDHQAYTVTYATQCCSFRLGYDRRDFVDNSRNELLLVVNLSGIGDVLKLKESQGE